MYEENSIESPIYFFNDVNTNNDIDFDVPGKPFAKQRPRASRRGNFTRVYTPKDTINYESLVKYTYYEKYGDLKLDGPLQTEITGIFTPPKSISKKKEQLMLNNEIKHTKKPDCDNMAKICLDALNGVAYDDDSQITDLIVHKRFGEFPKVNIKIKKIDSEE